jgi:glycosyltransferase involved in cell wall biosynthesis
MHPDSFVDLKELSKHLNIQNNVIFADPFFGKTIGKTQCSSELLSNIYSVADLYLSTSCGEGWGLTAFEAAACGTPIAIPHHTSYKELIPEECCLVLPTYGTEYFMNRRWPVVDTIESAKIIHESFQGNSLINKKSKMTKYLENRFDWSDIIQIWNNIICQKF